MYASGIWDCSNRPLPWAPFLLLCLARGRWMRHVEVHFFSSNFLHGCMCIMDTYLSRR